MLIIDGSSSTAQRLQGAWVTEEEVRAVAAHWRRQSPKTLTAIAGRVPDEFVTRMVQGADGARALLWAGDAGYLEGRLDQSGSRHRLWLDESDWRYERDFDSAA